MTQTFSGYLIDKREYEALIDIEKRLASAKTNLSLAERQDVAWLLAIVLSGIQSMTLVLEHGFTKTLPLAGEEDDT